MNTRSTRIAAALMALASAAALAAPVQAEEAKQAQPQLVDTRTTGSIAYAPQDCDPNDPDAGIVCRVTKGERDARFPSAPVNPAFGF